LGRNFLDEGNIVLALLLVPPLIRDVLLPRLTIHWGQTPEQLPDILRKASRAAVALGALVALSISVSADELVLFLYSEQFASAGDILKIFIWVFPFILFNAVLSAALMAVNRQRYLLYTVLLQAILHILSILWLVPTRGPIAAAAIIVGVEALGNPHPAADVEAILALKTLFDQAGLEGKTTLRLNNLGCDANEDCRPAYRTRLRSFLSSREAELCENCRRRIDRNPLRALDCKGDAPKLTDAPVLKPCAPCREHVETVSRLLKACGCGHVFPDPGLVRGLDYYTRTVFEFQAAGIGSQDAIAGGGRYDALVKSMGGPDTPAVGWALGLERTLLAVEAADQGVKLLAGACAAPLVFVAVQSRGSEAAAAGTSLMETLRRAGCRVSGGIFASSLKAQMKEASRQEAASVVIIGDEELSKNPPACLLRDMGKSSQEELSLTDVVEKLC